jgi:hypothetical protein
LFQQGLNHPEGSDLEKNKPSRSPPSPPWVTGRLPNPSPAATSPRLSCHAVARAGRRRLARPVGNAAARQLPLVPVFRGKRGCFVPPEHSSPARAFRRRRRLRSSDPVMLWPDLGAARSGGATLWRGMVRETGGGGVTGGRDGGRPSPARVVLAGGGRCRGFWCF